MDVRSRRIGAALAALLTASLLVAGCDQEPDTPGQALDKAIDKTGQAVEKTGEAIRDAAR